MIMTVYSLVPGAPLPEALEREDRPVYVPPDTGRDLPEALRTEPRLNGIPDSPGKTASFLTRLLWWLRFLLGIGSPAESARQVRHRARSFAEELLQRNEACVVAAEDSFLELFLRALREQWKKAETEEEREKVTRAVRFGLAALDHRDLG